MGVYMMEVTKDILSNRCIIESLEKFFLNLGNVSQYPKATDLCSFFFFFFKFLFIWLHRVLAVVMQALQLQHVGSRSLTRDQTWALCIGSVKSQPLDHQGSPQTRTLKKIIPIHQSSSVSCIHSSPFTVFKSIFCCCYCFINIHQRRIGYFAYRLFQGKKTQVIDYFYREAVEF